MFAKVEVLTNFKAFMLGYNWNKHVSLCVYLGFWTINCITWEFVEQYPEWWEATNNRNVPT